MLHLEVLVVERPTIYAECPGPVMVEEVASLDHELRDAGVS
jgi:hypothetical protein